MSNATQHLLYYLKRMLEQMIEFVNETIRDEGYEDTDTDNS